MYLADAGMYVEDQFAATGTVRPVVGHGDPGRTAIGVALAETLHVADLGLAAHLGVDIRWQVDVRLTDPHRDAGPHGLVIGQPQLTEVEIAITQGDRVPRLHLGGGGRRPVAAADLEAGGRSRTEYPGQQGQRDGDRNESTATLEERADHQTEPHDTQQCRGDLSR